MIKYYFLIGLLMLAAPSWAQTKSISLDDNTEVGALYPIDTNVVSSEENNTQYLSFSSKIYPADESNTETSSAEIDSNAFIWSYNRGLGTFPNTCPSGYSASVGFCTQDCPAGYSSVLGVCWQDCPANYTDLGLICTDFSWFPDTIGKDAFIQNVAAIECAEGLVNEAGLCYQPCEESLTGIGPLCIGDFNNASSIARITNQIEQQQEKDTQIAGQNVATIAAEDDGALRLQADMSFAPIGCHLDESLEIIDSLFGLPSTSLDVLLDLANSGTNDAIDNAIIEALANADASWIAPSIADTILFDLSASAECEDDGTVATATINLTPSITVQASTKIFDPVLHSLAGVDLGIISVSVYELIPFRIYGTVGTTLSTGATLVSELDRSQPPVILGNIQVANKTALNIMPEFDVWLSAQAYLRVTSLLSFIPDLLQLGADFNLDVLELDMPYSVESTITGSEGSYGVYATHLLESDIASGHGYLEAFFRILGQDIDIFGENSTITWEGYSEHKVLINQQFGNPVEL